MLVGAVAVPARVSSLSVLPSPLSGRVGVHITTFEACSSFTRVTACRVAHPPYVGFIARLRPGRFPGSGARKLPSSTNNLLGWVLPPLVICAVEAHRIVRANAQWQICHPSPSPSRARSRHMARSNAECRHLSRCASAILSRPLGRAWAGAQSTMQPASAIARRTRAYSDTAGASQRTPARVRAPHRTRGRLRVCRRRRQRTGPCAQPPVPPSVRVAGARATLAAVHPANGKPACPASLGRDTSHPCACCWRSSGARRAAGPTRIVYRQLIAYGSS